MSEAKGTNAKTGTSTVWQIVGRLIVAAIVFYADECVLRGSGDGGRIGQ